MKTNRKLRMAAAVAVAGAAVALAGCGGWFGNDDNGPEPATTEVPDSAGSSSAAFVTFLQTFVAGDESSEPLTIKDSFTAPADETSEPTPLT